MNNNQEKGISKLGLIALIISSSIGAGAFGITSDLARVASGGPALIAWGIVGLGVLFFVMSLLNLSRKRDDLNAGLFVFAQAGFGRLAGFISGWSYWLAAGIGNIALATMMMSALGNFFPLFGNGQNVASVLGATICIWILTALVNRGIESASLINTMVMICKLIPLFVFVVAMLLAFKLEMFHQNFWLKVVTNLKTQECSLFDQVRGSIMVMMWLFVGVEGATVLANRAKRRNDAYQATYLGLLALLVIYMLVSILPYGVLSQAQLAQGGQPALADVLQAVVGKWGANLINLGLVISVGGAWLSWTLLPAEVATLMTQNRLLPQYWGKLNNYAAPTFSLVIAGIMQTVFVLSMLFTSQAYTFAYTLCTSAYMLCYLLVTLYQVKYSWQNREWGQTVIGVGASVFQLTAILLAGLQELWLITIAFVPGFYFFNQVCRQENRPLTKLEKGWMAVISCLAFIALVSLCAGIITI